MKNSELPLPVVRELKRNHQKYLQISQLAMYSSLESISALSIFTKSTCDVQCNVVFCFDANKFDSNLRDDLCLYIIRTLDQQIPKLKNQYSIAYLHADGISAFSFLKNTLTLIPQHYMQKLKKVYMVESGTLVKIISKIAPGAVNTYLHSKMEYIDDISQIEEMNKVTLGGNLGKSKLKLTQEKTNKSSPFGVTHEQDLSVMKIIQNELYGKQLQAYELCENSFVPKIIRNLVIRLYSCQQFLRAQGMMRKSCDVEQLEILQNNLIEANNGNNSIEYLKTFDNGYVIAGCLKKIFNNLYSPLFSYSLYAKIINYQSTGQTDSEVVFIRTCLNQMENMNRRVLLYMIAFLLKGIVANKQYNKMSAYNLAVVFGPCFFRPKVYSLEDLMSSGKFSSIVLHLMNSFEQIVGPEEANELYDLLESQKMTLYSQ